MPMRFIGQLPEFIDVGGGGDTSDFRNVPASDRGNDGYHDRGKLGSYATNDGKPFETPADIRTFGGYGATEAELRQGYCDPSIREDPAYDKINYASRSSRPRVPDEDMGNADWMRDDLEFQSRNRVSKGFLTRPRIPTERG